MTVISVKTLEEVKQTWLSQMICILHSLHYDINIDLIQRRIYIFWCLDEKLINNWTAYTKLLQKLLAQDNEENKIRQKFWCLYHNCSELQLHISCRRTARATLSNKCNTFNTFINVKRKVTSSIKLGKNFPTQLKSLKINTGREGLIDPGGWQENPKIDKLPTLLYLAPKSIYQSIFSSCRLDILWKTKN